MKAVAGRFLTLAAIMCCVTFGAIARSGQIIAIDNSIYVAMVDPSFDYSVHSQRADNWCWAACAQMVLDYQNVYIPQSTIVSRVYGGSYNLTANRKDIVRALNGWSVDGYRIRARYENSKSAEVLINDLVQHYPIIVGLNQRGSSTGHAYVLTHIYFTRDYYGNLSPFKVVVVNPASSYSMEEALDWDDFFNRINTIIHVYAD